MTAFDAKVGDYERYDAAQLLNARLWIARLGESDVFSWWRTDGILGPDGAFVGPRVLPLTHPTARARIAFAVAAHTCGQRYPDPVAVHLFRLDPMTEDMLDALLVDRLDDQAFWQGTMSGLESLKSGEDPAEALLQNGIVTSADLEYVGKLKLGPDRRSLPIPAGASSEETVRRLAAGFVRSVRGSLAVPYLEKV